jgi:uncharacterized membrane protein
MVKSLKFVVLVLILIWMTTWTVSIIGCGGGGAHVRQDTYTTTLGQELQDLEEAYKAGIVTEKEYNQAKDKLIKQRTKK